MRVSCRTLSTPSPPLVTCMRAGSHVQTRWHAGGNLTRQEGQDRIDFLAQARNLALEVLWLNASAAGLEPAREVSMLSVLDHDTCFVAAGPSPAC